LFSSSLILVPNVKPSATVTTIQNATTPHFIRRPQTMPAVCLFMICSSNHKQHCQTPVALPHREPAGRVRVRRQPSAPTTPRFRRTSRTRICVVVPTLSYDFQGSRLMLG